MQSIQENFRAAHSFGFSETQIKNICRIIDRVLPILTGNVFSCGSGGGHYHFAVQMKDNRWLFFNSATGDITVSAVPYKTEGRLYKSFWNYPEKAIGLFVQTSDTDAEFNEGETLANRILNKEFKPTF